MRVRSLSIAGTILSALAAPVSADDASTFLCDAGRDGAGGDVRSPTLEETQEHQAPLMTVLAASGLVKVTHHCELDTTRAAALMFRATEALGCTPGSAWHDLAVATANHDEETNYRTAVYFARARANNPDGVAALCASIDDVDLEGIDATSLEDATALSRTVGGFSTTLSGLGLK